MEDRVFPIHAEAHSLPFAEKFFDALVSLDAYHYFGTNDLYMDYYSRFAKDDGEIGIVVPGLVREFDGEVPSHLAPFWESDYWSLHSPKWWKRHWEKTSKLEVKIADMVPDGWKHWLQWLEVCGMQGAPTDQKEIEMLRSDEGRNLGFTHILARKKSQGRRTDWLDMIPGS